MRKLLPVRVDFAVFPGTTLPLSFIFLDSNQVPINITGKTVVMQVFAGDVTLWTGTKTEHVDPTNGETHFDLPYGTTALFQQYERVRYMVTLYDSPTIHYVYFTGDIKTDRA